MSYVIWKKAFLLLMSQVIEKKVFSLANKLHD